MDETKNKVEDDIFTADSVAHGSSSVGAAMNRVKSCLNYSLKQKYGIEDDNITETILRVHGLSKKNLEFINNFESLVESKAEVHSEESEEANIDQNSNKSDVSVSGILVENATPIAKLLGYRYLYRKMVELYGKQRAKFLCGEMYDYSLALADSSNILKIYCFSINASRLVLEGRPFGKLHSLPPHRVSSYIACLNETVHQLSNHTAGALAIATLFLDCARVMLFEEHKTLFRLRHNKKYRKYIRNCLQNFVHSMNHLSRNSTESPFTNVSIFDKSKLRGLLDEDNFGWYFDMEKKPWDASGKDWTNYCVDVISEIQDIFMDIMDAGDVARNGLPITFPVTTLNISVDDDRNVVEPDFVKKICKHDIFRYNIFVSQGNKIASCCFTGDQMFSYYNEEGKLCYLTFKEFVEKYIGKGVGEKHLENSLETIIDPNTGNKVPITGVICMKNDWHKIITLELEDGSVIKATPNQKFFDNNSKTFVMASEIYEHPERYDI